MKVFTMTSLVLLLAVTLCPASWAQNEDTAAPAKQCDKPGVGLQSADRNADGLITWKEMAAGKPGFPKTQFDKLDTDQDGALSQTEITEGRQNLPRFGQRNGGPGQGPGFQGRGPGQGPRFQDRGPGQGPGYYGRGPGQGQGFQGRGPGQGPGGHMHHIMRMADTDRDRRVSYADLQAVDAQMSQERFNMLDRNEDGYLSPEDRPQQGYQGQRGPRRGQGFQGRGPGRGPVQAPPVAE